MTTSWIVRLLKFAPDSLACGGAFRRTAKNAAWLLADQGFRLGAGLLVSVWIARHLGAERFGVLSFALAIAALFLPLTALGLNSILVRDLVQRPENEAETLAAARLLKLSGAAIGFGLCLVFVLVVPGLEPVVRWMVIVIAMGNLAQTQDIFDLWLQARGRMQCSALVRSVAFLLAAAAKVALILADAPLLFFAVAGVGELVVCAIGWVIGFRASGGPRGNFAGVWPAARRLWTQSWPIALAGLAAQVQAYIDQVMLGRMATTVDVGHYSASLRLVSFFAFVPMVLQTAVAPEIARAKTRGGAAYHRDLSGVYRAMFLLFLGTFLVLAFLAAPIVRLLYGSSFAPAASLLPFMALRLFFTNFGVARTLFITNEGLFRHALVCSIAGAVVNVTLNALLIPVHGAGGAIAASLVSYAVAIFALDSFNAHSRENLKLMAGAIWRPWRSQANLE